MAKNAKGAVRVCVLVLYGLVAGAAMTQENPRERSPLRLTTPRTVADGSETLKLAGLDVAVWRPAEHAVSSPPILFSHAFNGCNTQSTFLMQALARAGYTVFAPNHKDAACGSTLNASQETFRDPSAWSDVTYKDRRNDLNAVTSVLRTYAQWSASLDWAHAGLAGHSLGGYTVLGLDGGWPNWRQTNFKAVLAMSPYCEPFLRGGGLAKSAAPVMYQGGTLDLGITPAIKREGGCYDKTAESAWFVEFSGAGHLAWTDVQKDLHEPIAHYAVGFFDAYLRNWGTSNLYVRRPGVADLRSK